MHSSENTVAYLNSLLRGELAATETYEQALESFKSPVQISELKQVQSEHEQAVTTLRHHIRECGGKPDRSSGAWGAWAKLVAGAAKLLGETVALKALKEGEEQGISDYEKALQEEDLAEASQTLIRNQLLPQTQAHLRKLDELMTE
jgi:uncharacterized protein (TIGR02284 family)